MTLASWTRLLALPALLLLVGTTAAQDKDKDKPEKKAAATQVAHIRLHGGLSEAPVSSDPLFGGGENFKMKLDRIKKAAADKNIQGLVIQLDGVGGSYAKVEEIRKAIAEFKKSGKKVYAYLENGEAKDFLVAVEADHVSVPAGGWLMLVGTRMEVSFYKELLEKLGVRAEFLQMGIFKFAAEPFTRTEMSKAARAHFNVFLDDMFAGSYVNPIARGRKGKKGLDAEKVKALIDEGPFTPRRAAELGLIDSVGYMEDLEALIKKDLGGDIKVVRDYGKEKKDLDLSSPLAIFKLLAPAKTSVGTRKDRIALIYASGIITTGKGGSSILGGEVVGSTTMIEAIREAEKDPKVRAIVLRVDSPGGSALASDLICNELKKCKKPVVATMSDVAASGGYYISMGAKKVYAQPGTLTGSIGVVGGKFSLDGLYAKVGIKSEVISRGKNSGILSLDHTFTPGERKAMERMMEDVYDQFLQVVIDGRDRAGKKFTREQLVKNYAEGRIWTGRQALEYGLIDALGGLDDAVADAKVLGGLTRDTEVDYLILPKAQSLLDSLMESGLDLSLLSRQDLAKLTALPEVADHLRTVEGMLQLRNEPAWVMMPHGVRLR